ncbi:MAG: hypothetical protein MJY50_03415 [Bacteroidales bacterium]|nr:hypothetical protein [Bacteroidales bacterium]
MEGIKTDWYFIVNPRAGSGKTMCEWVPAERKFSALGIPFTTAYTDHRKHAVTLAHEACSNGFRNILAVGGDGSLHETYNGIMSWCRDTGTDPSGFNIAVVPIGSGNDWIKSLNVPHDTGKVVNMIAGKSFGFMDVVEIVCNREDGEGRVICNMANVGGLGFDSHVCQRVNAQKERGFRSKMIYLNALCHTITHLKPVSLKVMADGREVYSGSCYSIALGNGRYSGSGMRQVPLAEIDDGLLDVAIVPRIPLFSVFRQIPLLFTGKLNESSSVISLKCRQLDIVPLDHESNDIIEIDGEIEGRLPATIRVTGERIGVIKGTTGLDEEPSEGPARP